MYALKFPKSVASPVEEKVIKAGLATDYNSGTIVELTAVPADGWEFVEWSGDSTSIDNPSQISINGSKTVKARFKNTEEFKAVDGILQIIRTF